MNDMESLEKSVREAIGAWDLSYVVARVVADGMPEHVARIAIAQLREFFVQARLHPDVALVPQSHACDLMWHEFIVADTRTYHRFCNEIFGEYVHHSGLVSAEALERARAASARILPAAALDGRFGARAECTRLPTGIPGERTCEAAGTWLARAAECTLEVECTREVGSAITAPAECTRVIDPGYLKAAECTLEVECTREVGMSLARPPECTRVHSAALVRAPECTRLALEAPAECTRATGIELARGAECTRATAALA
jgi:hypothetical protein